MSKNITIRFSDSEYQVLLGMVGNTPVSTFIRQSLFEEGDSHSDSHDRVTVTEKEVVTVTKPRPKSQLSAEKIFVGGMWITPGKGNI